MSDIALAYIDGVIDIDFGDGGTAVDDGLRTAVIISLFTDRRAEDGDVLPGGGDDLRGFWGDTWADVPGDLTGSRLWLLGREKQMASVLRRAEQYAREALAWMLDDGVARAIDVVAFAPADGVMGLSVAITRPEGDVVTYAFDRFWEVERAL